MSNQLRFWAIVGEAYACDACEREQATVYECLAENAIRGLCLGCMAEECESLTGLGRALLAARSGTRRASFPAGESGDWWHVLRRRLPCQRCDNLAVVIRKSFGGRGRLRLCRVCAAEGAERAIALEVALTRGRAEVRAEELEAVAEAGRLFWGLPVLDSAEEMVR